MGPALHTNKAPLKILLADTDYSEFLSLKQLLSEKNGFYIQFFWCGERDQYRTAVRTGMYDLILMDYCVESLFVLEQAIDEGCRTPVVLLADQSSNSLTTRAARCGALGVLNRKQPEQHSLKYFVLCADRYH
jgi:two-component system cell cycle sensor histidine kinase/response regulator CckA